MSLLPCTNVLMQRLSDSARTGKELLYHAFYLLSQTGFIEIETEYVLA